MTRFLVLLAAAFAAAGLRRAYLVLCGHLYEIESQTIEAVGRLKVLTADSAGGYESEAFATVSAGGREQLETAQAGAGEPRLN